MTMPTHNTDVAILNMESGDEVLHGNVLMVYEDQQDSPSCTAAFIGHLLWFADQEAVPFESGTLITTVPFRIETSRLGKPVESAVFSLPIAENEHSSAKAYALLWHLIRRREYVESLMESPHDAAANQAAIALRLHPQGNGAWCLGVQRRNPLLLLGQEAEFAHFHRVTSSEVAAREIGEAFAELISRQFEIDVSIEVKQRGKHRC